MAHGWDGFHGVDPFLVDIEEIEVIDNKFKNLELAISTPSLSRRRLQAIQLGKPVIECSCKIFVVEIGRLWVQGRCASFLG